MHNKIEDERQLPTYSKRQRIYKSNAALNSFGSSNIYGETKLFVQIQTLMFLCTSLTAWYNMFAYI